MKYTIEGFSQEALIRLGLDNTDAVLLRWFSDFQDTGKMKDICIKDGDPHYQWISYQTVIDDLPCLGIHNREAMAKRFKKLCQAGVLAFLNYKFQGTYTCFRKAPGYRALCEGGGVESKVDPGSNQKSRGVESKVDPKTLLLDSSTRIQEGFSPLEPIKTVKDLYGAIGIHHPEEEE